MSFEVYEARSEEEHVGNILLVISDEEYRSDNDALMALWIEAQEYSAQTDEREKTRDFKRAKEGFLYREISVDEFTLKARNNFSKLEQYPGEVIYSMPEEGLEFIRQKIFRCLDQTENIYVLEEDFSSYFIFFTGNYFNMLFSWDDVI